MPRYYIVHSYGEWSAGTMVECLEAPWIEGYGRNDDMAVVYHIPTKKQFEIPSSYLVPPRPKKVKK